MPVQTSRDLEVRAEALEAASARVEGALADFSHMDSSIGTKAVEGSMWMIGATGTAKLLGFVCQLGLAWFLTKEDYGVYAIAISFSVLLSVLRDGGLPMVLEQRGSRFDEFVGPVFWMMLALNTLTAVAIAAMSRPVARLYDIQELAGVIQLFALSIPLSVLPSVLSVRLAVNLRFRELSLLQVISAFNRNVLLMFFAWHGFGPRSFLLPLVITNVIDSGTFWAVTRYAPWTRRPNFPIWPELFRSGRWVLLGTFAIGIGNNGAYLVLGKILPSAVVGIFFFSYQLVIQLGTLLSDNVYQVLVPTFVRIAHDAARVRAAVPRALSAVVLIGSAASLSIAAAYEPLERALWHGKWSASSQPIYVLAAMWPAVAGVSVLRALQMATGGFQAWGLVTIAAAALSISGTVAGAYVGHSATAAAFGFSIGAVCGAALNARYALSGLGIGATHLIGSLLRPWSAVAGGALCAGTAGALIANPWTAVFICLTTFAVLSVAALLLVARESVELVIESLRRLVASRLPGRLRT